MKRLINKGLSGLMAAVMLMTVIASAPFTVNADDSEPDFLFEKKYDAYSGNQYYKLTKYNGNDENVVVPDKVPNDYPDETLRGKDFSIIKESAFSDNRNIKSVTIQDNVNHIGEQAFSYCTNLEEVTIGTSLDYLAPYCFSNCTALSKVTIYSDPSEFNLKNGVFNNCPNVTVYGYHGSSVERVMKENEVPFIGLDHIYSDPVWNWADDYSSATAEFKCTYGDDTQVIEANISQEQIHPVSDHSEGETKYTATAVIGNDTYTDEKTKYTNANHNVEIYRETSPTAGSNGNKSYRYCYDCKKFFEGLYGDTETTFAEMQIPYFTYEYTSDGYYKLTGYNGDDEDITIPDVIPDYYPDEELRGKTATIIKQNSFKDNTTIKTVTIPDNIDHVGYNSFLGCTQLTEVTIRKGLNYLGTDCFSNCPNLEKVTIYSTKSDFGMSSEIKRDSPNVTVYGYHGTEVENKMNANNVPFVSIGHYYGEPVWNWQEDHSSASASFTCVKEDDTQTLNAEISSTVTKEATVDEDGEIKYTATVTFEGQTYTDEKTVTIPKIALVASVTNGDTTETYTDLQTALLPENWVAGSTLTLLADADVTSTITVPEGAHTLDLNGFGIRAEGDQNFSVISIPANAKLTLNDSGDATHKYTVENSLATVDDSLEGEDIPTFTGGYITGGKDGAVNNSGVFTMNAGTLIGNRATNGGGIFNGGTVNISGGQIIYNVARQWGGGIYMSDVAANTVNLSGGAVTHNLCNNNGGGIQVSVNDKVNISGAPVVKDNYVTNGSINNINLSDGIIAVTGQLGSAASIGVKRFNGEGGVITDSENIEFNNPDCFISDKSDLVVGKDVTSGQLKLHTPYTITWKNDNGETLETDTDIREGDMPVYNGATPVKTDDEQGLYEFDKWSPDVTAAAADATYAAAYKQVPSVAKVGETLYGYLTKAVANWTAGSTLTLLADADVTETITVPEGAHTLDLNGFGIRAAGDQSFSVITIPANAELTLNDSGDATHKYTVENSLATVDDSLEGEDVPTFTGGYITGGKDGAVNNIGVFTMNAGTLIGNRATNGGGIFNGGTVNISGGQIIYNIARQWGGGIYMSDVAANTVNLSGGAVTHNLCNNNGGGIQVSANDKVNISGNPVVTDNYSTNYNTGELKNNLQLSGNGIIAVTGQLDAAASIGVRRFDRVGVITNSENAELNNPDCFTSDHGSYVVGKDLTSGQLKLHIPYTITWKNDDGEVLEKDTNVREGDMPVYNGETPVTPGEGTSYYVFDKWSPDVTAATADATYRATYTEYQAVAKVGDTLYTSFPEAVTAADGADITLLADIDESYELADDQTIRVILNGHLLTVNAPEGAFRVNTSTDGDAAVYRTVKLYAEVDGTKYESFRQAANATNGKKTITLLRDMDAAFSMNEISDFDILRVKDNGFEANIIDYVRKENKKGVTYYYKKDADAYVDGSGVNLEDGVLIIGTGAAVVVELGSNGGEGVTVVVGEGAEVLIDGDSEADFEPENPDEECLEKEEQEDGSKKIKNLKYHWIYIDTGISYLDAAADVWPGWVNEIWETYSQNTASIIKITPPMLDYVGKTDVKFAIPYPEGWIFPMIPYLPEAMNPGSHFIGFFEGTSATSYGAPFIGKTITEDLSIVGIWFPYEAAVIKADGDLEYYMTFEGAAEERDGNIVKILSAPMTSYTLKKVSDEPLVYEVLRVKRGNYMGGTLVNEPGGVPDGYGMRTWTYTDEDGEVVTCYTIDGAFTATFVYNNGTPDTTQTVYSNQLAEKPEDPTKPGAVFLGWYADEQLTQPFDFTKPVYGNVTLYAKWQGSSSDTGSYKFKYTDRYGDEKIKSVEVSLNEQEKNGYSGNNYQAGVPTYIWTTEAQALFDNNPLVTAALAVTGNEDDDQKNVSVYKNDIEWDLIKLTADDATNMTPDVDVNSLTVLAHTKPVKYTFQYYFVKDGSVKYGGTITDIPYGKPVTFSPEFNDPEKYEYINEEIPQENFCYWSADEAGLIPITTNRTFGMLMKGEWDENAGSDSVVNVYAQYNNNLTDDWMPLIEEATFSRMIDDDNDWVYLDYMTNYLSNNGTVVKDLVDQGNENIRYGLIAVKHPFESTEFTRDKMIELTQSMIVDDSAAVYTDESKQSVAYRFEYGKQGDEVKPITNFNRALYTLNTETAKAENNQFSVMAYITVDGTDYFYSKVNNDINVHDLLSE